MKPILPSLRQKKRYLVFEIISNSKISKFKAVSDAIYKKVFECLGEFRTAEAGIMIIKFDNMKQKGIIKVNHNFVDLLKSALIMITKVGRQKVVFKSVGVSGILKKAEAKFI